MIQFNLLPDIKLQYLKAQRQKHLVVLISTFATIASLAILLILISTVQFVQKKSIKDLSADIKTASNELASTKDLTKILTVQNQLNSLQGLHDKKAVASRLFGYFSQVTPTDASISKLSVDFVGNAMAVNGAAKDLTTINKFADTLKFTMYAPAGDAKVEGKNAFTNVVLSSFSRDSKAASYTITMKFDPLIFSQTQDVTLTVPKITTTRSELEQPSKLFEGTGN